MDLLMLLCLQIIGPTDRLLAFALAVGAVSKVCINLGRQYTAL